MRKHLLSGTALAAAVMLASGGAVAADKKMSKPAISVNGYYEAVVGGIMDESIEEGGKAVKDTDTTAVDVRSDSEIHFNGRATTDNGMKIHMRTELEGQQGHGERIDEYFLSISGSFGQIILGGTGGAPVKMLTGLSGSWATGVGETLNFDNTWVPSAAGNHYGLQHSRLDTGDAQKATYISPKFGGFQVGLTYSPNKVNDDDNSRVNTTKAGTTYNGLEGAISYSGKFGDVGFGVGAGMTAYQGADGVKDGDESDWLVAARLDFGGGFRVSAAHKRVTNDDDNDGSSLTDVGVRFVQGANSFSLVGSQGEMEEGGAMHTAVMGSYARSMGPGVKVHLNAIWNSSENGEKGAAKLEASGTALVSGIKVSF